MVFSCLIIAKLYAFRSYFAVDAKYSANDKYSLPYASVNKRMFLYCVQAGCYSIGHSTIEFLQNSPIKQMFVLIHLLITKSSQLFVSYNDIQAYPDYLITFKM